MKAPIPTTFPPCGAAPEHGINFRPQLHYRPRLGRGVPSSLHDIPNTFGIPAQARVYAEYTSVEELRTLLQTYKGERLLHIGAGSNLLFTNDFDGVVLHSRIRFARALEENAETVNIEAGAGIVMDDLIAQVADMGLYGLENLSHIPGEVGASAIQNVGAYGVEAKDVIHEVHTIAVETGEERIFTNEECRFGYRDSIFKNELKGQYIVTSVVYRLSKQPQPHLDYGNLRQALAGKEPTPMNIREAVIAIRKQKLPEPEELGSAGSFFKNPIITPEHFQAILRQEQKTAEEVPHYETANGIKIPAAWLIEQCGWKGKRQGGAQVYEKQPLVIVNTGNATAQDIITLAANITESIAQRFQITLQPEVNYIYEDPPRPSLQGREMEKNYCITKTNPLTLPLVGGDGGGPIQWQHL